MVYTCTPLAVLLAVAKFKGIAKMDGWKGNGKLEKY